MHDIWNPRHGCVKYSEGCRHCYMYFLDRVRDRGGREIPKEDLLRKSPYLQRLFRLCEKGERGKRTHRLCNLGGTVESLAPEVKELIRTEILLHQTAKKYFDRLGISKLPSVKELRAEYAELLSQKRKVYAAYKQARADMKELFNVKSNVEYLLEIGQEHGGERDKTKSRNS